MVIIGVSIGIVLLIVFGFFFLLWLRVLDSKARRDEKQYQASKCAAVADDMGFHNLAEILRWFSVGAFIKAWRLVRDFFEKVCDNPEELTKLAYNIFTKTWAKIREHPEYGDKARQKIIEEAFSIEIDDQSDLDIIAAAARCRKMGWDSLADAGEAWAKRRFRDVTLTMRSVFKECMSEDGLIEIAKRVAPKTLEALLTSKVEGARELAKALIEKYAEEFGWTPPTTEPQPPTEPPQPAKKAA